MDERLSQEQIVADYWSSDRKKERPHSWLQHSVMRDFLHRRITGNPQLSTVDWFKRKFFAVPVDLCLSLGCGFGDFERAAISLGIATRFHAHDLAPAAVETAQKRATEAGMGNRIDYSVENLDRIDLPSETYDAVFGISAVHHVFELERLFRKVRASLKPGGLFFLDEYVGPSRFQCPSRDVELINKLLRLFPVSYRSNILDSGPRIIEQFVPSTVEHFETVDPSEAIRSGEILQTLRMYFEIVEFRPYGGAILHMLFTGIMGNFDEQNERDVLLLNVLATMEEELEQRGVLGSDFAVIVAKPKVVS